MVKRMWVLVGAALVLLGVVSMAITLAMPLLGVTLLPWVLRRIWPFTVVGVGLAFVLPPLLSRHRRGLGGLFIPGVPILATGGILLFTSVLHWWRAWEWLWPIEVLAVAVGFFAAAAYMRVIWLTIPAIIIGVNGLVFQFCAVTGLWDLWAVLWAVEPLSVGLSLLLIGAVKRRSGLTLAGLILCAVAGVGLLGMTAVLSLTALFARWWVLKIVGPAILVLVGLMLVVGGVAQRWWPSRSALR